MSLETLLTFQAFVALGGPGSLLLEAGRGLLADVLSGLLHFVMLVARSVAKGDLPCQSCFWSHLPLLAALVSSFEALLKTQAFWIPGMLGLTQT